MAKKTDLRAAFLETNLSAKDAAKLLEQFEKEAQAKKEALEKEKTKQMLGLLILVMIVFILVVTQTTP